MQRDGHYPYQAPIDAYGNGGFRFADMSHRGSILCLPGGIYAWPVVSSEEFSEQSFAPVFAAAGQIDVLMVGTGEEIVLFEPNLRRAFKERGIVVEAVATGSAVRIYNIMLGEQRAVGAALIAVDNDRVDR